MNYRGQYGYPEGRELVSTYFSYVVVAIALVMIGYIYGRWAA